MDNPQTSRIFHCGWFVVWHQHHCEATTFSFIKLLSNTVLTLWREWKEQDQLHNSQNDIYPFTRQALTSIIHWSVAKGLITNTNKNLTNIVKPHSCSSQSENDSRPQRGLFHNKIGVHPSIMWTKGQQGKTEAEHTEGENMVTGQGTHLFA